MAKSDDDLATAIGILLGLLIAIAILAAGPIFTIWSLNCLFHLEITLSFGSWLAAAWLTFLFFSAARVASGKKNK